MILAQYGLRILENIAVSLFGQVRNRLLKSNVVSFFETMIRNRHTNRAVKVGARFCEWYLFHFWNQQNWDVDANGESLVVRVMADHQRNHQRPVVFDVGANAGAYTDLVRRALPNSEIHCFEVVPDTRKTLEKNLAGISDVFISEYGLSNATTRLKIGCTRANDTQSRVLSPLSVGVKEIVDCDVRAGDQYMAERHIQFVDLLKIDTEGHEMAILEGFQGALGDSRIRMIQFEYGTTWIAPSRLLYEAFVLLEPHGFIIGRLYPDGVMFKPYDRLKDDHFRMGNYVAVHRDYTDLIESLSLK